MTNEEILELVEAAYTEGFFEAWHHHKLATTKSNAGQDLYQHSLKDPVTFEAHCWAGSESYTRLRKLLEPQEEEVT